MLNGHILSNIKPKLYQMREKKRMNHFLNYYSEKNRFVMHRLDKFLMRKNRFCRSSH